jgi:peptidoglycan glycosyltransferase
VSSDGVILAESRPSNDEYERQRVYPQLTATLFAHVVGYQSIQFGEAGVERTHSDDLAGRTFELRTSDIGDILATRQPVGTVVLTLSTRIQALARQLLANRNGSVVVLDVRTGAVVAAYSNPTFDPNLLVSHDVKQAQGARSLLLLDESNPLLPHAWAEIFPPGSTFKTVTASIALEHGIAPERQFPELTEIALPLTAGQTLRNFGGERCGGSLFESFVHSCNTTFAQVGFDLGETLAARMPDFGIETAPPPSGGGAGIDPPIARSTGPEPGTFSRNQPAFMQDAIGQHDVRVTPLEMALVAEAVATGGEILNPYVVDCVKDPDGRVLSRSGRNVYKRAMRPDTAATMNQFMRAVVERGTGTGAQIPGVAVAGKTGTAETGDGLPPHAWFIAFAPADQPRYAVAVLVEHGGGEETTGGRVAAPIARDLLAALLATPPAAPQCGGNQP